MSSAIFNSRLEFNGVTTQTVAVSTLAVGDCVYRGVDATPFRIRHIDRFPGGRIKIVASPAIILDRAELEQFGVFAPTDTVKRVVIS